MDNQQYTNTAADGAVETNNTLPNLPTENSQSLNGNSTDVYTISPNQTEMFGNAATEPMYLEIPHQESSPADANMTAPLVETMEEDGVSNGTKAKVLAALAVVAVAGYIAYWVQEPLQIKADVLSPPSVTDTSTTPPASTSKTVADASTTPAVDKTAGDSKSVDVSLFGFEPAVLKIDKGTTVVWTNTSSEDQTIIGSSKNGDSFTSKVLTSGDTFSRKFDKDGNYQYYSTYNPALKANITVGLGDTAAAATAADNLKPAADATTVTKPADATSITSATAAAAAKNSSDVSAPFAATAAASNNSMTASTSTSLDSASLTAQTLAANAAADNLKSAAENGPKHLAKTGPEDAIYVFALLAIAYFNRKKLIVIFK